MNIEEFIGQDVRLSVSQEGLCSVVLVCLRFIIRQQAIFFVRSNLT
jgi:hypothetical protein